MNTCAAGKPTVLWVGRPPAPVNLARAVEGRFDLHTRQPGWRLDRQLDQAAVAVVPLEASLAGPHALHCLLHEITLAHAVTVVMVPSGDTAAHEILGGLGNPIVCVDAAMSPEELATTLHATVSLQPAFRSLQSELSAARHISASVASSFEELDEEMRLASRLQRDFLPRRLPLVGRARFDVLFRPAGWVSGDIYDVTRLDETHVGFYVIDAVGHGMPAALLTMFIKRAIQTKRINGNSYEIIHPHESMARLNADICSQELPSCQFCTGVYCVLNTADLTLSYTRAGHPEPVLLRADGSVSVLNQPGGLLGIIPDELYATSRVQLAPGDRLVLYSDGASDALRCDGEANGESLRRVLTELAHQNREQMLQELMARIGQHQLARAEKDEITVIVLDVEH